VTTKQRVADHFIQHKIKALTCDDFLNAFVDLTRVRVNKEQKLRGKLPTIFPDENTQKYVDGIRSTRCRITIFFLRANSERNVDKGDSSF